MVWFMTLFICTTIVSQNGVMTDVNPISWSCSPSHQLTSLQEPNVAGRFPKQQQLAEAGGDWIRAWQWSKSIKVKHPIWSKWSWHWSSSFAMGETIKNFWCGVSKWICEIEYDLPAKRESFCLAFFLREKKCWKLAPSAQRALGATHLST